MYPRGESEHALSSFDQNTPNALNAPSFAQCVLEAILTSRQLREKLQCLYENLVSNNFCKMAVLKKYEYLQTKATQQRILPTNF